MPARFRDSVTVEHPPREDATPRNFTTPPYTNIFDELAIFAKNTLKTISEGKGKATLIKEIATKQFQALITKINV